MHEQIKLLNAQNYPHYQQQFKSLSLQLIRATEFFKSKRPDSSSLIRKCLSIGGDLVFGDINKVKVKDLKDEIGEARVDLLSEISVLIAGKSLTFTQKNKDSEDPLPDLFGSFLADIKQHLHEFKPGSREWLFEVRRPNFIFLLFFLMTVLT